jgi:hypothetical protein
VREEGEVEGRERERERVVEMGSFFSGQQYTQGHLGSSRKEEQEV